eukprot:1161962-Pelagomonas_calceolata.AAC.6
MLSRARSPHHIIVPLPHPPLPLILSQSPTVGGGAWPFLVGGLPCQVDSSNVRDLSLTTPRAHLMSRCAVSELLPLGLWSTPNNHGRALLLRAAAQCLGGCEGPGEEGSVAGQRAQHRQLPAFHLQCAHCKGAELCTGEERRRLSETA